MSTGFSKTIQCQILLKSGLQFSNRYMQDRRQKTHGYYKDNGLILGSFLCKHIKHYNNIQTFIFIYYTNCIYSTYYMYLFHISKTNVRVLN
jgi:hypothetical protein